MTDWEIAYWQARLDWYRERGLLYMELYRLQFELYRLRTAPYTELKT